MRRSAEPEARISAFPAAGWSSKRGKGSARKFEIEGYRRKIRGNPDQGLLAIRILHSQSKGGDEGVPYPRMPLREAVAASGGASQVGEVGMIGGKPQWIDGKNRPRPYGLVGRGRRRPVPGSFDRTSRAIVDFPSMRKVFRHDALPTPQAPDASWQEPCPPRPSSIPTLAPWSGVLCAGLIQGKGGHA